MNWEAIKQRIDAGEDQRTGFMPGVGDLSALGKAICAFANSAGGVLVLGVDDGGRLGEQVDRSVGWFLGLGRIESYEKLVREDRYLLPRDAIREALVNAVIHRDYAIIGSTVLLEVFPDRVDITSPGSLPNHLTVEQVKAGAHPRTRNDSMGHYMAGMGYMEKRGRGWLIMQREMRKFNGTEPALTQNLESSFVRVTFQLGAEAA